MLANQAQASTGVLLLAPADHANTTAATGSWVDISAYEGSLAVTQITGVVTAGTIVGKIQHADDDQGTNAADVTGAAFASVGTSTDNAVEKIAVPVNGLKPYIRYVGTITTGPAVAGASFLGTKKYV